MNTRNLLIFLVAIFMFAPAAIAFAEGQDEGAPAATTPPRGARVIPLLEYAEGSVRINGEAADLGQDVPFGSVIQTGEDSYGEISIGSANIFRIHANSVATLELDAGTLEVNLRFGAIGAVFDKVESIATGGTASIKTPNAVAGVRGTVFFVNAESLDAGHHEAYRYTQRDDGYEIDSLGLIYHDDSDMERLAESVGVSIEWAE